MSMSVFTRHLIATVMILSLSRIRNVVTGFPNAVFFARPSFVVPRPTALPPLSYGRRRRRSTSTEENNPLEWERFEFGNNPKWDKRFSGSVQTRADKEQARTMELNDKDTATTSNTLTEIAASSTEFDTDDETDQDKQLAHRLDDQLNAWEQLSPNLVTRAIATLEPYVKEERIERIQSVLRKRTRRVSFLFENPINPSNVWACLRTLDAFGIQHVHVVIQSGQYQGKAALSQKRGMRTAMGSAQWLTVRNHRSTQQALQILKEKENCVVLASDLSPGSMDIREIDWDRLLSETEGECLHEMGDTLIDPEEKSICIVMGNEERGISQEMRQLADATFTLPMVGFAESFNLSVATAITLAHLSAASSPSNSGPLRAGDLPEHEYQYLYLKGLCNSLPQRRLARALLRKEGIELPQGIGLV